jgi:DNA sulfur modification protein DndC
MTGAPPTTPATPEAVTGAPGIGSSGWLAHGSARQPTLWEGERISLTDSLALTAQSLNAYGADYEHWAVAFSGGKDSSATVAAVAYLLEQGRVKRPKSLTVLMSDTRMELPPLFDTAMKILAELKVRGVQTKVVQPAMDDRFFVYMFGRGVPPPSNTFRWCTPQLKIEPMVAALKSLRDEYGQKFLMLTGVRIGESAARDARIAVSCGKNNTECGQGWFQESTPESVADTLAPLLHWRLCHVWDWLTGMHDLPPHGFSTGLIAAVYGQDENLETHARTGCVGCNLASRDMALEEIIKRPQWAKYSPLMELRPLYAALKLPRNRLRKDGTETRKDGSIVSNPCRMGPLTFEARRWGLEQIKSIQARAGVDLINADEEARIIELIEAQTWPRGWDGDEPLASVPFDNVNPDGSVQPIMRELVR